MNPHNATITLQEMENLKSLALAATPGPWKADGRYIGTLNHMSFIGEVRDQNGNWSDTVHSASNSAFIAAANPKVILELLSSLEQQNTTLKV